MSLSLRKAARSATKARVLLEGPAGSGKTTGALLMAGGLKDSLGLSGDVIVIDTERGSSDAYEERIPGGFQIVDLEAPYTPERFVEALQVAEGASPSVIVIDSISHAWSGSGGCLELNDSLAKSKYRGNSWSAWSETKLRWRRMLERIIASPAHVILTGRSKTETAQVDEGGRKKVVRLGMKLESEDSLAYEMMLGLSIVHEQHFATVTKDRTGLYVDRDPEIITAEFGERLGNWIKGSKAIAPPPELVRKLNLDPDAFATAKAYLSNGITSEQAMSAKKKIVDRGNDGSFTEEQVTELLELANKKAGT